MALSSQVGTKRDLALLMSAMSGKGYGLKESARRVRATDGGKMPQQSLFV
jgi:hypothetical protein